MSPSPPSRNFLGLPAPICRELLILAGALAFGVLVMPPLVWLIGSRGLGPYAGGGPGALAASFFHGLASASFAFWAVAFGPYLITLVVRALVGVARDFPAAD